MMEISWLAFYIWLHLLLAALLLPGLVVLSRQPIELSPQSMLRLWTLCAALLLGLPALLLQAWALDQQFVPWFAQGVQQVLGEAQTALVHTKPGLEPVAAMPELAIKQIHWPLLSQQLSKLAPPSWLWWLLPLVGSIKLLRLIASYLAARKLRQQALPISQPLPPCPLPVKSHPTITSAMLLGLRQPLILLPQSYLQRFDASQLALILQHEVCHHQQGDLRSYLAQQLLGCLLWWSPAWHRIAAELNRWRELRCDALVSRTLPEPHRYAQTLLDCTQLPQSPAAPVLAQRWWQQPLLPLRIAVVLQAPQRPGWRWYSVLLTLLLWLLGSLWLAQRWQLAELPARHAKVRVADLAPLTQLLAAVAANDLAHVRRLLATGAPLNLASQGDGSALMVAVRQQLPQMVELLLQAGADPNLSSRGDGNALIIAVKRGDLQLARRLLDAGADVNAAVLGDETALINASMRGDLAMARLLLDRGALINLQVQTPISDGRRWRSALNQAANLAMRDFLLMRGAR
nr:M56 family metallopeptidase [uncultured Undibacterium sp.]